MPPLSDPSVRGDGGELLIEIVDGVGRAALLAEGLTDVGEEFGGFDRLLQEGACSRMMRSGA